MGCVDAAANGQLKFGFCLGGNLYGSNPDATYAARALGNLDSVVYLNTTLNTGHAHGLAKETLILPVLARDEEPQPTTQESMFSYVRYSDGGEARHIGPRSEISIVAELARLVLGQSGPIDWGRLADAREIRAVIGKVIPGWEKISEIDRTKQEFHITGRRLDEPNFPTANGRGRLHVHGALPALSGDGQQLRLMTVRSEGQFNTVVYEDYDLYRGQTRRDIILMHPDDLERLGLADGTRVRVHNETGGVNERFGNRLRQDQAGQCLDVLPPRPMPSCRGVSIPSLAPRRSKNVLVSVEPISGKAPAAASRGALEIVPAGASTRDQMRAC